MDTDSDRFRKIPPNEFPGLCPAETRRGNK